MRDTRTTDPEAFPRALLFDCDGTLLLTSDLHFTAISQAVERQGSRMRRDWYMELTGLARSDLFAAYVRDFGTPLNLSRAIKDSISLTISLAAKARENRAVATIAREASGRLSIAVVTNSETAVASALLHAAGLLHLFDVVLGCESASRPKPAPDLYLAAAARLGCSPADCLVFEDSNQGILAANAAGMRCIDVREPDWQRLYKAQHRCPLSAPLGREREVR